MLFLPLGRKGFVLGTHGQAILDWVNTAIHSPELLSPVALTPHAHKALLTLITMLNSLPAESEVLQFILQHMKESIDVVATVVNGKIVPNTTFVLDSASTVPRTILDTCSNAGTYVFTHLETGKQYIGSATSLPVRLAGHLSQLAGELQPSIVHDFIHNNGGLSSVNWGPVYNTYNFVAEYNATYPIHWVSKGEWQILQAFTQFLPRLLEQSLFTAFSPELNSEMLTVYFNHVSFNTDALTIFDYDRNGSKPIDVFNIITGDHFTRLASVTAASIFLFGQKDRRHIVRKHLGALSGIKWSAPHASAPRVVIAEVGQSLTDRIVPGRPDHNYLPLEIPGLVLSALQLPFIYIYNANFELVGTFTSFSEAMKVLNPSLANLTARQLEIKSRVLQRRCNWHVQVNTESGLVYTARHPSLVNRKKSS